MQTSLDISYYPLSENYRAIIIELVDSIKTNHPNLRIESNGLSTQIFGDYEAILLLFHQEIKLYLSKYKSVFIVKLAAGERTPESIPNELKP